MDFTMPGKIVYNPVARGGVTRPWWAIVECPMDIIEHQRYWIKRETGIKINRPLFGSHISLIRGEEPPDDKKEHWGKHEGEILTVSYKFEAQTKGQYWWLEAECPELYKIRKELGLHPEVEFGFHLTIGKIIPAN